MVESDMVRLGLTLRLAGRLVELELVRVAEPEPEIETGPEPFVVEGLRRVGRESFADKVGRGILGGGGGRR